MYTILTQDKQHFSELLDQAHSYCKTFISQVNQLPPHVPGVSFPYHPLQNEGQGAQATLKEFNARFQSYVQASAGARYFGFVVGGGTPAALMGDWLVSTFDQTNSSIQDEVERETLDNLRELFCLPAAFAGNFVTGATMANFSGLATARQWWGKQHQIKVDQEGMRDLGALKVLGAVPHASIFKALSMLGLGRQNVEKVASLPQREAIDVQALETALQVANGPCIVTASAGTVNTADFDDLKAIGALKKKYPFWLHVDAAFGGFAACSPVYSHYWKGIEQADSVTIDAHKWLNVPYDSAVTFTRHQGLQHEVFLNNAAYLDFPEGQYELMNLTPENSRRWRGLPVWFTLKAYGKQGYQEITEQNCAHAQLLGSCLQADDRFELLAEVRLNVACFTFKLANDQVAEQTHIKRFLALLAVTGEVFMSPTFYKGQFAIRAAFSNWRTQTADVEKAWELLQQTYNQMKASENKTVD